MTNTIEAVARALYVADTHYHNDNHGQPKLDLSVADLNRWYDENAAMPLSGPGFVRRHHVLAQAAITTHTAALIAGAGELEQRLLERTILTRCEDGSTIGYEPPFVQREAAATIAALKAEIERLTEREAQAKLDGVKAGIEAAAELGENRQWSVGLRAHEIRALDAEAIAKGITTAEALSELAAADAVLLDMPDTLADSDGDDGA